MTRSVFDGCTDACGWIAAVETCLTFGTHGVAIKESFRQNVDAHPLVIQSYKTIIFFLSSFLVVFLGEDLSWTPKWGLMSGALWFPGATLGTYAIMYAGMATSEGTWSSVIVMVNFFWGILVFHEGVKSLAETGLAFVLLTLGLVGMSLSSTPAATTSSQATKMSNSKKQETEPLIINEEENSDFVMNKEVATTNGSKRQRSGKTVRRNFRSPPSTASSGNLSDLEKNSTNLDGDDDDKSSLSKSGKESDFFRIGDVSLTRRQVGIVAAAINGFCGGTSLVPMHYAAKEGYSGARYYVSYATGSFIVCILCWFLFLVHQWIKMGSILSAFQSLPKWHPRQLLLPSGMSGILFSAGMFGSIISVAYLGQGIGNTAVQVKIMVAGLWGLLYYKEIKGFVTVTKWFLSAILALVGIVLLSHEHKHLPHH